MQEIDVRDTAVLLDRTAHVHLRDAGPEQMQVPVGEGNVDFVWIVDALAERGYQGQLFGIPQPWPADTPAHLAPQGFQDLLARSMDACKVPAELVGFDCEEVPCIAMLRPGERGWIWSLIRDCPEWAERFRRVPLRTDFWADCGPGETEHVVLLSPFWADFPGDRENLDKRLGARFSQIRDRWRCGRAP